VKLEYVWLDGTATKAGERTPQLRSKVKIWGRLIDLRDKTCKEIDELTSGIPRWNFDGSSTQQAQGKHSDCILQPVRVFRSPFESSDLIVLCEVVDSRGSAHPSNARRAAAEVLAGCADQQPYETTDGEISRGSRLDRVKAELVRALRSLPESWRFNVITYGHPLDIDLWAPALRPATREAKAAAEAWVMAQGPLGITATGPAVVVALGDREVQLVVLLTDGRPNAGLPVAGPDEHRRVIRRANVQGAQIDVYGVAVDPVARAFCQGVAADAGGSYVDVP